ncbi:MAG: flagellar protein FlgN [Rubrobacteraceae bacterium]
MADFAVTYEKLEKLTKDLQPIIDEFEHAEDRADELESYIGDPFGRNDLREAAEDFEDRWNNKRDSLKESLGTIKDAVDKVIKYVREKDEKMGGQIETAMADATKK